MIVNSILHISHYFSPTFFVNLQTLYLFLFLPIAVPTPLLVMPLSEAVKVTTCIRDLSFLTICMFTA